MAQTNKDAQEVMDKYDSTIRVEVQFPYSGAEVIAFDTTVTPNHVNIWNVEDVNQYNMIFTEDQAKAIAAYWKDKRSKR
jgi:hypothetical protein